MNKKHVLCALCLLAMSPLADAANYTLWINGRTGGGTPGNYADFRYWAPATTPAGINKKAVNWNGRSDGEDHDHYGDGNWSGIIGVWRQRSPG